MSVNFNSSSFESPIRQKKPFEEDTPQPSLKKLTPNTVAELQANRTKIKSPMFYHHANALTQKKTGKTLKEFNKFLKNCKKNDHRTSILVGSAEKDKPVLGADGYGEVTSGSTGEKRKYAVHKNQGPTETHYRWYPVSSQDSSQEKIFHFKGQNLLKVFNAFNVLSDPVQKTQSFADFLESSVGKKKVHKDIANDKEPVTEFDLQK